MKKMIFLLVSAVALLFSPALPSPIAEENQKLNDIIDLAGKYNRTLYEYLFVEDVSELAKAGCNNTFLCKVDDILINHHQHFINMTNERKIVRNLNTYIRATNVNCTKLLKVLPTASVKTEITELLTSLVECIRVINLKG